MSVARRKHVVGYNPTAVEQWIQGVGREGGSLGGLPIGGHLGLQPERWGEFARQIWKGGGCGRKRNGIPRGRRTHAKTGMDTSSPLRTLTPAHLSEQTTLRLPSVSTGIYQAEAGRHEWSIQSTGQRGRSAARAPAPPPGGAKERGQPHHSEFSNPR